MKPIYKEDFADLSPEKKLRFVYDLDKNAQASFQGKPHETQLLAQTLIFTRWWNSTSTWPLKSPRQKFWGRPSSFCGTTWRASARGRPFAASKRALTILVYGC